MGLLDFFSAKASPATPARAANDDLFDDEFQRKLDYLALVSRRVFAGRTRAERRTKKSGSGVEFVDHRDYTEGDDLRSLDWNLYQRFGKLLVRLYEEEEDLAVYLIVDASSSMGFGDGAKFRYARKLAAALAYVGLANLDRVSVAAAADNGLVASMPPTRGKQRIFKVLDFLRHLEPAGATDLGDAMKAFVARNKRRGVAVLVSDFYDPAGFERGVDVLRYNKFEPFALHVVDRREAHPALRGDVRLYDCETGDEREVTVTARVLARYAEAYNVYVKDVERYCVAKQVPYVAADVSIAFDELVLRIFRRGGFLR